MISDVEKLGRCMWLSQEFPRYFNRRILDFQQFNAFYFTRLEVYDSYWYTREECFELCKQISKTVKTPLTKLFQEVILIERDCNRFILDSVSLKIHLKSVDPIWNKVRSPILIKNLKIICKSCK